MLATRQGHRQNAGAARATVVASAIALFALAGCAAGPNTASAVSGAAWGFVSLALLLVAAGAYALGAQRARTKGERALRQSHADLRHQTELQEGWQWHTDAQHRLRRWQPPGQAASSSCALFEHGPGSADLHARLAAQQTFGGLQVQAAPAFDGARTWRLRGVPRHDDHGRFAGFVGTAQPIDEQQQLAAAAAALQPLLALNTAPVLLAQDDGAGWRVQQLNDAAHLAWPALQVGSTLADAASTLPPAVRTAVQSSFRTPASAARGAAEPLPEGWRLASFATPTDGHRSLVLTQAAAGPRPGNSGDARDAAESDNFSFTVSHDLRAPIRVVEGFTRIVKEDYGRLLDRVGNDHLDRVLGAAARMNLMIDALLTLARLSAQPLARQPVNLSQLAAFVVDELRRAAPERDADIDIEPGLTAQGDPTLLRLVLENLLGNAWKYSARSSRAQISLRTVAHGDGPAYAVRDNGAGFDMRSADRLFGLFQRLHSASEFAGHGVGLASVRRIVRRHGGDVWAEAELGKGAAFFFTLAG